MHNDMTSHKPNQHVHINTSTHTNTQTHVHTIHQPSTQSTSLMNLQHSYEHRMLSFSLCVIPWQRGFRGFCSSTHFAAAHNHNTHHIKSHTHTHIYTHTHRAQHIKTHTTSNHIASYITHTHTHTSQSTAHHNTHHIISHTHTHTHTHTAQHITTHTTSNHIASYITHTHTQTHHITKRTKASCHHSFSQHAPILHCIRHTHHRLIHAHVHGMKQLGGRYVISFGYSYHTRFYRIQSKEIACSSVSVRTFDSLFRMGSLRCSEYPHLVHACSFTVGTPVFVIVSKKNQNIQGRIPTFQAYNTRTHTQHTHTHTHTHTHINTHTLAPHYSFTSHTTTNTGNWSVKTNWVASSRWMHSRRKT